MEVEVGGAGVQVEEVVGGLIPLNGKLEVILGYMKPYSKQIKRYKK